MRKKKTEKNFIAEKVNKCLCVNAGGSDGEIVKVMGFLWDINAFIFSAHNNRLHLEAFNIQS